MKDNDESAFPIVDMPIKNQEGFTKGFANNAGMSLRDYFAAKAMTAYMIGPEMAWDLQDLEEAAFAAYNMADAMLKQRTEE